MDLYRRPKPASGSTGRRSEGAGFGEAPAARSSWVQQTVGPNRDIPVWLSEAALLFDWSLADEILPSRCPAGRLQWLLHPKGWFISGSLSLVDSNLPAGAPEAQLVESFNELAPKESVDSWPLAITTATHLGARLHAGNRL